MCFMLMQILAVTVKESCCIVNNVCQVEFLGCKVPVLQSCRQISLVFVHNLYI